jgi:Transglutaminase-like superfamily
VKITPSIQLHEPGDLGIILEGLVLISLGQLRRGLCPPLYQSGARYVREPRGRESWQTAVETFRLKHGDCEDLSVYLAASKRLVGIHARCAIIDVRPGLKHCVVKLPDGSIEDPSKKLGMQGRG